MDRRVQITTEPGGDWVAYEPVMAGLGRKDIILHVNPAYSGGEITGTARNAKTRAELPGQRISLRKMTGPVTTLSTTADETGRFSFTGLKAGVYQFVTNLDQPGLSLRAVIDPATPTPYTGRGTVTITEQAPRAMRELLFSGPLRISGRLIDTAGEQGVDGVGIGLVDPAYQGAARPLRPVAAARTAGGGVFVIEDASAATLPSAGGATLGIGIADDNISIMRAEVGGGPGELDPDLSVCRLTLTDPFAERVDNIILHIARTAEVRGIVLTVKGEPCPGAKVFLTDDPATARRNPQSVAFLGQTRADGRFEIPAPMMKRMFAGARSNDGGYFFSEGFTAGPAGVEVTITLGSGEQITGVVADPKGASVEGAEVQLADATGRVIGSTVSDLDGRFTLTRPGGVICNARAVKAGFLPSEWIPVPAMPSPENFILTLGEKAELRLRIIDPERHPVESAEIMLFGEGAQDTTTPKLLSAPDGRAVFTALRSARVYSVSVVKGDIETVVRDLITGDKEHEIMLDHFFLIKCVITATDAEDKPVSGFTATAHASNPAVLARSPHGAGPWTCDSPDGRLEVLMLPGSDLHFTLAHPRLGLTTTEHSQWSLVSQLLDPDEPVMELGFPATFGLWGAVRGRVIDSLAAAAPVAGAQVALEPVEGFETPPPGPVMTDDHGAFSFERTRAGAYVLVVTLPGMAPLRQFIHFRHNGEAGVGDIVYPMSPDQNPSQDTGPVAFDSIGAP